MKFHVILEANNSHLRIAELARLAETFGMEGIWTSNMHDSRDPFINMTEAARTTETIRMGPVAVSPYELHPLKMANALLTLNEISGGRAQIGVGAGAPLSRDSLDNIHGFGPRDTPPALRPVRAREELSPCLSLRWTPADPARRRERSG